MPNLESESKIKKAAKIILIIFLAYLIFLIGGAMIPYSKLLNISEEYKQNFDCNDFYGDSQSIEWARPLASNDAAREEKFRAMTNAKDRIILVTFQFVIDESGKSTIATLLAAADRGVKVDVLVDGVTVYNSLGKMNYLQVLAQHQNVQVKVYNPFEPFKPWNFLARMHDKYLIVDDELYILGGRNIEDRFYYDNTSQSSNDWDTIVYLEKRAPHDSLAQLENYFHSIYDDPDLAVDLMACTQGHSEKKYTQTLSVLENYQNKIKAEHPEYYQSKDYRSGSAKTNKITLLANPTNIGTKNPEAFYAITELMLKAKHEVYLQSPYIIPNKYMLDKLTEISGHCPTFVLTNSAANSQNLFGAIEIYNFKDRLLNSGITLLEIQTPPTHHGKAFLVDDNISAIGTFNWDMCSTYRNTELMLVVNSTEFNSLLREDLNSSTSNAAKISNKENSLPSGHAEAPANVKVKDINPVLKLLYRILGILLYPFRYLA